MGFLDPAPGFFAAERFRRQLRLGQTNEEVVAKLAEQATRGEAGALLIKLRFHPSKQTIANADGVCSRFTAADRHKITAWPGMSPVDRVGQVREWAQDATDAVGVPFEGVRLIAAPAADVPAAERWMDSPGEGTCMVSIPAAELFSVTPAGPIARLLGSISGAAHDAARGRLSDLGARSRAGRQARVEVGALAFSRLGGVGDPPFSEPRQRADPGDGHDRSRQRGRETTHFQIDTGDIGRTSRTRRSGSRELEQDSRGLRHDRSDRDPPGALG